MGFFNKNAFICCFLIISSAFSGAEQDIGLSFTTPSGWKLTRNSRNTFFMDDTTALFRARFWFVVYENILDKAGSAKDWVIYRNLAYQINLQAHECYGILYASDTLQQDGLFSMYSNGEVGDCFMDVVYRQHYRFVANGNFGWDMGVETDSADMASQFSLYLGFLDSIKIKRDFKQIYFDEVTGAKPEAGRSNPLFFQRHPEGGAVLHNPDGPNTHTEWSLLLYSLDGRLRRTVVMDHFPFFLTPNETSSTPALCLLKPRYHHNRPNNGLAPFIFRFR